MIPTIGDMKQIADSVIKIDPRPECMRRWQCEHSAKWIQARLYYRFLYALAQKYKPQIMIELGTDRGYGAWHLAEGNPDGLVIAIDVELGAVVNTHIMNVRHIENDTIQAIDKVTQLIGDKQIGLIFFDSTHTKAHVQKEYQAYTPLCEKGAIQLFDDILESAEMYEFWDELPEPKLLLRNLHPKWGKREPGLAVSKN